MTEPTRAGGDDGAAPEKFKKEVTARFAVRLHAALILSGCFVAGLAVTKLLLMAGVGTMWLRYAVALCAAYLTFLLGVRIWLHYAGYDTRMLPSRRSSLVDGADIPSFGSGGSSGGAGDSFELPRIGGGGGRSGGGGASMGFGEGGSAARSQSLALASSGASSSSSEAAASSGSSSSASSSASAGGGHSRGGGFDLGDDGWVLILLIALIAAVCGAVVWIIYAAPTILADAAFAGMLSAGLARSTKHIASGGWVASVVGHTWFAFAVVFVLAIAFAVVAQNHFPEARTLGDVLRRL